MDKPKYQKPLSRSLNGLSGAEGACITAGQGPYGTACATGEVTQACAVGNDASEHPQQMCNPGSTAAICFINGIGANG
jgi:hypothetical protein